VTNATIFTLTGSTKSKGGELSIGGRLWNALTTKIALSYTDAATSGALGANAVLNGLPPRSVPLDVQHVCSNTTSMTAA